MSVGQRNAPVIIKRRKIVVEGGHHGGAWKVAYADFVTAMMAFFMLMWLLGATTEKQRKGIADYFNPTVPVVRASGGGSGAFGGDSIFAENTLAQNGVGAGLDRATADRQASGANGIRQGDPKGDSAAVGGEFDKVQKALQGRSGESMVSELLRRHVVTRLSDEGLVIELFDDPADGLFTEDGQPTALMATLIDYVVPVVDLVENEVAVQAHSRSIPEALRADPPWSRTMTRAEATRALLTDAGLSSHRIQRVAGFADRKPVTQNPMSPRNDRIEIVLLRSKV